MNNLTKRQHFVPKLLTSNFCFSDHESENWIWQYTKGSKRTPQKKSIKSINFRDYYYEGETINNVIEMTLGDIENNASRIIKSLHGLPETKQTITNEEKEKLSFFIAILITRNPSFRTPIKEIYERIAQNTLSMQLEIDKAANTLEHLPSQYADIFYDPHSYSIEIKEHVSLQAMITCAVEITKSILNKKWHFFRSYDDNPFLTSDNPVSVRGYGPAHPDSTLFVNLGSSLSLVIGGKSSDMEIFQAANDQIDKLNRLTTVSASKFIYASKNCKKILKLVSNESEQYGTLRVD